MDRGTYIGETYAELDKALNKLSEEKPELYSAILLAYLHAEAGHRDVDDWREKAGRETSTDTVVSLVERHDAAIDWLTDELEEKELFIRWPQKAPGPQPGQNMGERHTMLFAVFLRYIEDGILYRQAVRNAALKCEYSARHAERIIKPRWKEYNEG
jgi:hypothetical protein